jgi:hypothetical protein
MSLKRFKLITGVQSLFTFLEIPSEVNVISDGFPTPKMLLTKIPMATIELLGS